MDSREIGATKKPGMKKKWQLDAIFQQQGANHRRPGSVRQNHDGSDPIETVQWLEPAY